MTVVLSARAALFRHFRWQHGHADVWRVFADGEALRAVVDGLVAPWVGVGVTRVVGIEARGFLLGGACATALGVGFVGIRKGDGLLPGPKVGTRCAEDYRGRRPSLRMQRTLVPADRVLLVDDWAERGSQARGAADLVAACGAAFLGVAVMVDQLDDATRGLLGRVTSLVTAAELDVAGRPAP